MSGLHVHAGPHSESSPGFTTCPLFQHGMNIGGAILHSLFLHQTLFLTWKLGINVWETFVILCLKSESGGNRAERWTYWAAFTSPHNGAHRWKRKSFLQRQKRLYPWDWWRRPLRTRCFSKGYWINISAAERVLIKQWLLCYVENK